MSLTQDKDGKEKRVEYEKATILVHHLLSQLLPVPSNYFLEDLSRTFDGCPCGCNGLIHYGSTQMGSPRLFYGNADLVMFNSDKDMLTSGSVFTFNKMTKFGDKTGEYNNDEELDDMHEVSDKELEENQDESKYLGPFYQICKQAISASLCRKRFTAGNSRPLYVPVCGMSDSVFDVALYDPEADFLLVNSDPVPLFQNNKSLSSSAIINLWLMIHHGQFATKLECEKTIQGSCNLKQIVGEKEFDAIVNTSGRMSIPFENPRIVRPKRSSQIMCSEKEMDGFKQRWLG